MVPVQDRLTIVCAFLFNLEDDNFVSFVSCDALILAKDMIDRSAKFNLS